MTAVSWQQSRRLLSVGDTYSIYVDEEGELILYFVTNIILCAPELSEKAFIFLVCYPVDTITSSRVSSRTLRTNGRIDKAGEKKENNHVSHCFTPESPTSDQFTFPSTSTSQVLYVVG